MTEKYKSLREKYLLQDWWPPFKAGLILAGLDPDLSARPRNNTPPAYFVTLEDEKKIDNYDTPNSSPTDYQNALRRVELVRDIWSASDHSDAPTRGNYQYEEYDKDYCIQWAIKKTLNIPWLDWAIEGGYIETPMESAQHAPAKEAPKPIENATEAENRLRLISVLVELLSTKRKTFSSQNQLIEYITEHYNEKGLGKSTLEKVFAKARLTR